MDSENLGRTFDHRFWVRKVESISGKQKTVMNVISADGVSEAVLRPDETYQAADDVSLTFTGVNEHLSQREPFCHACGRGILEGKIIPMARIAIDAPRSYQILRSEAKKKYGSRRN